MFPAVLDNKRNDFLPCVGHYNAHFHFILNYYTKVFLLRIVIHSTTQETVQELERKIHLLQLSGHLVFFFHISDSYGNRGVANLTKSVPEPALLL